MHLYFSRIAEFLGKKARNEREKDLFLRLESCKLYEQIVSCTSNKTS